MGFPLTYFVSFSVSAQFTKNAWSIHTHVRMCVSGRRQREKDVLQEEQASEEDDDGLSVPTLSVWRVGTDGDHTRQSMYGYSLPHRFIPDTCIFC